MATTARFVKAVDNARPYKSHRYDVFGPKVQRMLTLYGPHQIDTWLLLESDPLVLSYCERPMVVLDAKPKLLVDFWAGYADRDELWLVNRNAESSVDIEKLFPSFAQWAHVNNFVARSILPAHQSQSKVYLENWGTIIRDLSANRRYLKLKLLNSVRELLELPRPITAICNLLPQEDPVLVRVAVYSLLHTGTAFCSDLTDRPLGPTSLVELT